MKRRNFILGGGLLATLSLGATATNASLADSVSSVADFRVLNEIEREADLSASPRTPGTPSTHTWKTNDITTGTDSTDDTEVDTIEADYDLSGGAGSFDGLDETNITVKIDRNGDGSKTEVSVNSTGATDIGGAVATFELSGVPNTNIAGDMTLTIDGIENPTSTGSFRPSLTLTNYNGDTISTAADLDIVSGAPFFESTITNVPSSFTVNNSIQVDYKIENTGDQTGTQTIRLLVDGTQEDSTSVNLDPEKSTTRSFSYTPTSSDGSSLNIRVESDDDSDTRTITEGNNFTLSLKPSTGGDTDSVHTWSAETISVSDFKSEEESVSNSAEEIESIDVDYSDNFQGSPLKLDDLTDDNITVEMTRRLDGGPDRSTISVNSGDYSGDTATFDLSGSFTTDITNDPDDPDIVVTIGDSSSNTGVENPSQGPYEATITLNGGQGSTVENTVSYETT
ncbi:MAG: hypothetical protein J07HN4v3_02589 [Halonotius sp. J07HN4]|nr:MAG: hypothetical protein J07HN4v3_02589 [Halonotius sp. J07HN4]